MTAAPGGPEGGSLAVHRRVAVLDAAVVATSEQGSVPIEQGGPDRDAAFDPAEARFLEGDGRSGTGEPKPQ